MFRDRFQGKLISVYYNVGNNPLADWLVQCKGGDLRTVQDDVLKSNVLQIRSTNVVACSITTPADPRGSLNVRLPFLTLQLKSLCRYFTFEVTVLDADNIRRRFRASNYLTAERTSVFASSTPLQLVDGWNQVQFNLGEFTERTYGTSYAETVRVTVHANCRLRRVYFSDRLYAEDQLPDEFRLFRTAKPRAQASKAVVAVSARSASKKAAGKSTEKAAVEATAVTTEALAVATEATAVTTEALAVAMEATAVATEAVSDEHDV